MVLNAKYKKAFLIISLSAMLNVQAASAQEMSLRAVYNALSGVMAPIWVGQDAGLFTKQGVNVDLKYLAATTAVQGMVGGGEEIGLVGSQGIDAKLEGAVLFTAMLSAPKVIREKNEAVTRFLRGYIESLAVIRKDKETTMRSMGKFLKTTDQAVLESVYDDYKDVFPVTPLISAAEVKAVLDVAKSPRAKTMKPEEFFDNSIVQKIQASGFIEQVNKR